MRLLNCRFRGQDCPTDVLSFHYDGGSEEDIPFLGDIVISPEAAFENAGRWRTPFEKEIRRLMIHGLLHLLCYDHETDAGEMRCLEKRLLRRRDLVDVPRITASGWSSCVKAVNSR
jgi:probable rRNA maturation factor